MEASGNAAKIAAALEDHRTAPIGERLRAALTLLEKLCLTPADVGPDDIAAARAAGLSDRAIEEAMLVCFAFSVMDRLADALDFELEAKDSLRMTAKLLLRLGYSRASCPG